MNCDSEPTNKVVIRQCPVCEKLYWKKTYFHYMCKDCILDHLIDEGREEEVEILRKEFEKLKQ